MNKTCPQCGKELTKVGKFWICPEHGEINYDHKNQHLRIFLSYGHDPNEELVLRIKADLEQRGHDVWFDKTEIKAGDDWRRSITDGILHSQRVISFLSKHSTRDPGVCRDEIAIAIGEKGGHIQTILVEREEDVKPPVNIGHIQWLDMHDWKEQYAKDKEIWGKWYNSKFQEIIRVVESDESRLFAGEIEVLKNHLKPIKSDARMYELLKKGYFGRDWLFEAVEEWRTDTKRSSRIFWITGNPGIGKSAFAAQLTHTRSDAVIAAQFVEWDKFDHRDAGRVIRSIAFQLATRLYSYRRILLSLPEISELGNKSPYVLFDYLLSNPLKYEIDAGHERQLIVIDALDEAGERERNQLVEILARNTARLPEWLGVVVTSRPESTVQSPLQGLNPFTLNTQTEANRTDIKDYLHHRLALQFDKRLNTERIIDLILEKSEGVFLYIERFCDEVQQNHLSLDHPEQFPQGLGGIFFQWFQRQFSNLDKFRKDIRPALRVILAAYEPLPVEMLQRLFEWQEEELRDFSHTLGPLFPVFKEGNNYVIKPFHKSLADWLTNKEKAGVYFVSSQEGHQILTTIGLQQYGRGVENMAHYLLLHLRDHLIALGRAKEILNIVTNLLWLETKANAGMAFDLPFDFTAAIQAFPSNDSRTRLISLLNQALRHELHFINRYPKTLFQCLWNLCWWYDCNEAELYYSPPEGGWGPNGAPWEQDEPRLCRLLERWRIEKEELHPGFVWLRSLSPLPSPLGSFQITSMIHQNHAGASSQKPISGSAAMKNEVNSVSISPDGMRIASGATDGTVCIWDSKNGKEVRYFFGHEASVSCVVFSPDGKKIVSGSLDKTIRIWNVDTGEEIACFHGHEEGINNVAISPDGNRIVSGSADSTIRIWDFQSGKVIHHLMGNVVENSRSPLYVDRFGVNCVAFSPDCANIVSGASDKTIRIWDADYGSEIACLHGHEEGINSLAISPDGKRIVSGSDDSTIRIWDFQSGEEVMCLDGHKGINTLALSLDGDRIVSGALDTTIRVWDIFDGEELACLTGHEWRIYCVAISPVGDYIVSCSRDGTIRVWNSKIDNNVAIPKLKGRPSSQIRCIGMSPSGKVYVGVHFWDNNVLVFDGLTGIKLGTLPGPEVGNANRIEFNKDGSVIVHFSEETCIYSEETFKLRGSIPGEIRETVELDVVKSHNNLWKATHSSFETVLKALTGQELAWFPLALDDISVNASSRILAASSFDGVYLAILSLEGDLDM